MKTLKLTKTTIANLEKQTLKEAQGGDPIFSRNPKKCDTLVPLCIETQEFCNQTGVACLP